MTQDEITLGEISRQCSTLNLQVAALRNEVRDCLAQIPLLKYQAETAEADIKRIDGDLSKVSARSAWVSGAIAAVGFLTQLFWPGKP